MTAISRGLISEQSTWRGSAPKALAESSYHEESPPPFESAADYSLWVGEVN